MVLNPHREEKEEMTSSSVGKQGGGYISLDCPSQVEDEGRASQSSEVVNVGKSVPCCLPVPLPINSSR